MPIETVYHDLVGFFFFRISNVAKWSCTSRLLSETMVRGDVCRVNISGARMW